MAGPACCAAATPVSTKMPVPMMQPMPSKVRSHAVSTRRRPVLALGSIGLVRNRFMEWLLPERTDPARRPGRCGLSLEDCGDAESAGGADRNEAAAAAFLVDQLGERGED